MRIESGVGDTAPAPRGDRHPGGDHPARVTGVGQRVEVGSRSGGQLTRIHFSRPLSRGSRSAQGNARRMPRRRTSIAASPLVRTTTFHPRRKSGDVEGAGQRHQTSELTAALADRPSAMKRRDELEAIVEGWTSDRDKHEVMALGLPASVRRCPRLRRGEANEHLRGRGMIVDVEHPRVGACDPAADRLSASSTEVTRAPLLGEHNAEILGKVCGLERRSWRS